MSIQTLHVTCHAIDGFARHDGFSRVSRSVNWVVRRRREDMVQLPEFLAQAGYRRIPLQRSGIGHFHAPGSLRGRAVSVLVDTGAGCTLVSLALARELNLSLSLLPDKGGGAGSADMDVYVVDNARLELAEVSIRPRSLLAMDLTHANQALALQGAGPVEAIMGLDVFEEHSAVIDYGSQSLFMRE